MKRLILSLFLSCLIASVAAADQMKNIQSAQGSLEYTLKTLRESVDRLTLENNNIVGVNDQLRARIGSLQEELAELQRDALRVQEQSGALEAKYNRRRGDRSQTVNLQEEYYTLDAQLQALSQAVLDKEAEDEEMRDAVGRAESELRSFQASLSLDPNNESDQLVSERDQLKAELQRSRVALQQSRDAWLEMREVSQGAGQGEALDQERKQLLSRIADKRASVAKLTEEILTTQQSVGDMMSSRNVDPAAVMGLEQDVALLNDQYRSVSDQLESVDNLNSQKVKKENTSVESEKQRLREKVVEESARNQNLRQQLDDLRKQMIEMDKKKVRLEQVVYGDQ